MTAHEREAGGQVGKGKRRDRAMVGSSRVKYSHGRVK